MPHVVKKPKTLTFFTFSRNYAPGFDVYDLNSLGDKVIIEAQSADKANKQARKYGLYFDDNSCTCHGSYDFDDYAEWDLLKNEEKGTVFSSIERLIENHTPIGYYDKNIKNYTIDSKDFDAEIYCENYGPIEVLDIFSTSFSNHRVVFNKNDPGATNIK